MNDLEYLNQIAAANRPVAKDQKGIGKLFGSRIFKIVAGAVVALVAIIIIGSLISGAGKKEKNLLVQIDMRMNNIQTTIASYNGYVKSARLRGMGASLSSTLAESSRDLYAVLMADYGYESEDDVDEDVKSEEDVHAADLKLALNNAKLNGILDRIYVARMAYEITLLCSMETEAMERSDNEKMDEILLRSTTSLNLLLEQFSSYSDATN